MPASPPRSWWSGSCSSRGRAGTTWAARTSSSASGSGSAQSGNTITTQMRRLGDSVDWSHEYFTMDEKLSTIVTETFVRLHEQGLIYRGKRLVNWDPELKTAVSDLEVESQEEDGSLWHIRYPLTDGSGFLTVATTRPETMLGDVAVMVHPEDERYRHLVGKTVKLPLCDREIPVIADDYVDRAFGTGVVKVTPAHDANDYAVGQRHRLPIIGVLTLDAKINDNAPAAYRGLDRFDARKRVVADLEAQGLLEETKKHKLMVPRCARTGQVIEPMLTDQWFVAMTKVSDQDPAGKSIAQKAIDAVQHRPGALRARELGQHLQPVDGQHPGLVHLAPALVGPPDPGLVRRGRQGLRRPQRSRSPGQGARQAAAARRGRAGHLVLLGAGALLHARLAGQDARPGAVPALQRAGDRLRHHLLLGRPDDHDDDPLHRPGPVSRRVHPRPGARCARPQDEQVRGQRAGPGRPDRRHRAGAAAGQAHHRPAQARDRAAGAQEHREGIPRGHSGLRRRRAALHLRVAWPRWGAASTSTPSAARATATSATSSGTHRVRADELRGPGLRPEGTHQGRLRARRPGPWLPALQPGRPLDRLRAAEGRSRGRAGLCRLPPGQRRQRDLRLRLEPVLRLVPGDRQGADCAKR